MSSSDSAFVGVLAAHPVLCDGAMGTLLYSKGIFINRCYDELNLSQPELITGIHQDYLHAGAEVIETNTFGGNSFRLARHGCADKVREINLAGARLISRTLSAHPCRASRKLLPPKVLVSMTSAPAWR